MHCMFENNYNAIRAINIKFGHAKFCKIKSCYDQNVDNFMGGARPLHWPHLPLCLWGLDFEPPPLQISGYATALIYMMVVLDLRLYSFRLCPGHQLTWQNTAMRCQIHHWGLQVQITKLYHPNACWMVNTTHLCNQEGNICVLSFCLRWLRGRCRQFSRKLLNATAAEACSTCENFQGPRHQQHPQFSSYQQQQMFSGTSIKEQAIYHIIWYMAMPYRHSFIVRTRVVKTVRFL